VFSCNHCCCGKAVLHILSLCLKPQVYSIQCACAILSSVARPALQYFRTLSHKRHDFRKSTLWTKNICFDFLYKVLSEIFLILTITDRDMIKNIHRSEIKVPVILVDFNESTSYSCPTLMKVTVILVQL
jgi:hypothetical protein